METKSPPTCLETSCPKLRTSVPKSHVGRSRLCTFECISQHMTQRQAVTRHNTSAHVLLFSLSSVFRYRCRNNPQILGENNQNLPRILEIISEVFRREALSNSEAVAKRLVNIVKQIQVRAVSRLFRAPVLFVQLKDREMPGLKRRNAISHNIARKAALQTRR